MQNVRSNPLEAFKTAMTNSQTDGALAKLLVVLHQHPQAPSLAHRRHRRPLPLVNHLKANLRLEGLHSVSLHPVSHPLAKNQRLHLHLASQ